MQPFLYLLATFLEEVKQKFIAASQVFAVDLLHALDSFGFDTDVMTIKIHCAMTFGLKCSDGLSQGG